MDYFPIFIHTRGRKIVFVGGAEDIGHKLILLGKSSAHRHVYGDISDPRVSAMITSGEVTHHAHPLRPEDTGDTVFAYIGTEDTAERDAAMTVLDAANVPYCVIDDRNRSRFITPALVDRDPVVVAIGTAGAAPVLARKLKSRFESLMPQWLGHLATMAEGLRGQLDRLPQGAIRRQVWSRFFDQALSTHAVTPDHSLTQKQLDQLIADAMAYAATKVHPVRFVSAGPGDPDLLTRAALKALDDADVVLHDRLVPAPILELCRREAILIETGKQGFGPGWSQADINSLLIEKAVEGQKVVRLKSGDAGLFGRLDEEIAALDTAGLYYEVVPGVTAAAAADAAMGVSLTRRGRNSTLTMVTGHDVRGYAEHDWRNLTRNGAVTAIYMGIKALPFIQGRLLMHGATGDMLVTLAGQVGHPGEQIIATSLGRMIEDARAENLKGPAIIMLGLHPHQAEAQARSTEKVAS